MHSVCTVSSESVKTPVIVKLQLWQCWERKINKYDLRYACVIYFFPPRSSSRFSSRYLHGRWTRSWFKSKEFFFFLFRCNAFHILALSQSFSLFHFEPVLPTESGFISTGGHALMRLNVGTENREHDATYGWILSLLHRPREDQLLQISCLPLGFKTLLWGRGGRRVTSTFPQGRSIFCPNLFPLVCKNEEKTPVASASCGVHSTFSHDSKYPMIRVEWAVHVHGNALNVAEDV